MHPADHVREAFACADTIERKREIAQRYPRTIRRSAVAHAESLTPDELSMQAEAHVAHRRAMIERRRQFYAERGYWPEP